MATVGGEVRQRASGAEGRWSVTLYNPLEPPSPVAPHRRGTAPDKLEGPADAPQVQAMHENTAGEGVGLREAWKRGHRERQAADNIQ